MVHGDNEFSFVSEEMAKVCNSLGIMYRSCAAYGKSQNGQAERMNIYISEQIRVNLEDPAS